MKIHIIFSLTAIIGGFPYIHNTNILTFYNYHGLKTFVLRKILSILYPMLLFLFEARNSIYKWETFFFLSVNAKTFVLCVTKEKKIVLKNKARSVRVNSCSKPWNTCSKRPVFLFAVLLTLEERKPTDYYKHPTKLFFVWIK